MSVDSLYLLARGWWVIAKALAGHWDGLAGYREGSAVYCEGLAGYCEGLAAIACTTAGM